MTVDFLALELCGALCSFSVYAKRKKVATLEASDVTR
jgi:hypothetical protein